MPQKSLEIMNACGANTFGVNKDTLQRIHIDTAVNGRKCNCMCPACRADLVARNGGKKRAHHFAHASGTACKWAGETDIHLMAKEIIKQNMYIQTPEYDATYYHDPETLNFDKVEAEVWVGEKKPDCTCTYTDLSGVERTVWIEIKVTHPVDEDKLDYIKEHNISCIEINLRKFQGLHDVTPDFLDGVLATAPREWLNAPHLDEKDAEMTKEHNKELRKEVASFLEVQFYLSPYFGFPRPVLRKCKHFANCIFFHSDCCEEERELIDIKAYYDKCEAVTDFVDNKVVKFYHSSKDIPPTYIAVYGRDEQFPEEKLEGKVMLVKLDRSGEKKFILSLEKDWGEHYHLDARFDNFINKEEAANAEEVTILVQFLYYRTGRYFCQYINCIDQFSPTNSAVVFRCVYNIPQNDNYPAHMYGLVAAMNAGHNPKHCFLCKHNGSDKYQMSGVCKLKSAGINGLADKWAAIRCPHFERNEALIAKIRQELKQIPMNAK